MALSTVTSTKIQVVHLPANGSPPKLIEADPYSPETHANASEPTLQRKNKHGHVPDLRQYNDHFDWDHRVLWEFPEQHEFLMYQNSIEMKGRLPINRWMASRQTYGDVFIFKKRDFKTDKTTGKTIFGKMEAINLDFRTLGDFCLLQGRG